ncbi:hypothetical protein VN12_06870 [Pirellula sp. SH-Sr6A]|nr:hypothetical protein VN12_06870 [Pirellula sp. SH-Sr6A]
MAVSAHFVPVGDRGCTDNAVLGADGAIGMEANPMPFKVPGQRLVLMD